MRSHVLIVVGLSCLAAESRAAESIVQVIDRQVTEGWAREKVQPAALCDDAEFVRRVYLDLIGRIPTRDEVVAFLGDTASDKRTKRIDALLAGGEFARHWRENLHVHLMGGLPFSGDPAWRAWLETALQQNRKWDEIARDVLRGRSVKADERGPAHFLASRLAQGETGFDAVTRDVSRIFFGVDIQCARCHKHPDVKQWKQESYWGMLAFYRRSYLVPIKGQQFLAEQATGDVEYVTKSNGKVVARPTFLGGERLVEPAPSVRPAGGPAAGNAAAPKENPADYIVPPEDGKEKTRVPVPRFSRRDKFVEGAVQADNPFFKRAIVNYVWAQMLGRGLVEPIDQMHDANPGSHPELLRRVADDFTEHRFDLRYLVRAIASSRTYQLSSRVAAGAAQPPDAAFACGLVRALSAQQLATALLIAAGYYEGLNVAGGAVQPDPAALRARLETQQTANLTLLAGKLGGNGTAGAGVAEALFQANSREFAEFLARGGQTARLTAMADTALPDELFLRALSRHATAEEVGMVRQYLRARPGNRSAACEQLLWALVASSEFRFNH
jgi:hypothetical protein